MVMDFVFGATCTLTPAAGGAALTVATDEFGDFWFKDIEVDTYALSITANGFDAKVYEAISTEEDVNLGDIAL
jgi:tetrathionate reductase subunit B